MSYYETAVDIHAGQKLNTFVKATENKHCYDTAKTKKVFFRILGVICVSLFTSCACYFVMIKYVSLNNVPQMRAPMSKEFQRFDVDKTSLHAIKVSDS